MESLRRLLSSAYMNRENKERWRSGTRHPFHRLPPRRVEVSVLPSGLKQQLHAAMVLSRTTCFFLLQPFVLFFVFFIIHQTPLSLATDTISANQSLSWRQNITSNDGQFALGFFTLPGSSNKYYVGIWYNKISELTPAWVANRDIPVTDPTTSELKIADDGNLVLLNQSKYIIWSTDANISSKSTVAVILDSGNLQLRDESNSSLVFWQSFDYPTDTWLPGGKLGLNKVTNQPQYLTAWKSKADPAHGIFSLSIDPKATKQYFIFWNMSKPYWTSGVWNDQIFSMVPEMTKNYVYDFKFVSNPKENYFTYTVKNNITSRFVINSESGQIQQLTWMDNTNSWMLFWSQPRSKCLVYAVCGPFGICNDFIEPYCNCLEGFRVKSKANWDLGDKTAGCERNTPLQCSGRNSSSNPEKDGFLLMSNVRLPDNSQALGGLRSAKDCESGCLNNCSCTAYSYNSSGCFVWYGDLLDLQEQVDSDESTLYLRLAAADLPRAKSKKTLQPLVIVGIVAVIITCFAIAWVIIYRRRSRRMINKAKAIGSSLVSFRYSELQHFTKNFSEKLGGGGFGSVFKGILPDKTPIAVKKLEGFHQGEKQFRTEVSTIGTIQHVNLVRLLGFCSEASKKLLVYEFMPNGSLDTKLFHHNSNALDWKTRYQIAAGTARGLTYLHEQCRDCIIHCDIKPENILLDASFTPKVADFGLAKLVGRDFSRVLTTMRGTRGYLAPEWITGVPISTKADVYSYGMMLFEIISGRRNLEQREQGGGGAGYFPALVASKLMAGDVHSLLDPRLGGQADEEELERACKLACWCIQDGESSRPTMGQVVQVLEGILKVSVPPVPTSLQLIAEMPKEINFFFEPSPNSSSRTMSADSSASETKSTK
ncbi:G-type lectin S-receptor-like serine/threonine-protein kinase [Canna indica]|uniref:Receptor-like serine/threonine-protein kinase n=1 Tax=Canna indica TaxID=4628 RepID=A0AAQ3QKL3_9LILI|nr:G-type lectin S-receptor-like serine/threonine-protein kinase [Canna indica]